MQQCTSLPCTPNLENDLPFENHLNICVLVTANRLTRVKVGIPVESTVTRFNGKGRAMNGPVSTICLLVTQILALPSLLSIVWEGTSVDCLAGVGAARVHCELITT